MISVKDFAALDLRVATITEAARVAGTTRLLRLGVDLGSEQRTLVAGLARSYAPEELVGRQVVVVANLEHAVIRSIESEGMLLGVGCDQPDEVAVLTPDRPVRNGARAM